SNWSVEQRSRARLLSSESSVVRHSCQFSVQVRSSEFSVQSSTLEAIQSATREYEDPSAFLGRLLAFQLVHTERRAQGETLASWAANSGEHPLRMAYRPTTVQPSICRSLVVGVEVKSTRSPASAAVRATSPEK